MLHTHAVAINQQGRYYKTLAINSMSPKPSTTPAGPLQCAMPWEQNEQYRELNDAITPYAR
jgi:hypothetical protein